jgi:hypothetical protein
MGAYARTAKIPFAALMRNSSVKRNMPYIHKEGARAMSIVDEVVSAAKVYDRPSTEAAAEKLMSAVHKKKIDATPALKALRDNRWFDLLRSTGDAFIESGQASPGARRLYAQALIDTGAVAAAVPFLEELAQDAKAQNEVSEYNEARGLIGRAWKQAYVDGQMERSAARSLIQNAAAAYYPPYKKSAKNYWHGINTVACLARAERDGITVSSDFPSWRALAKKIRDDIAANRAPQSWDYASAAEACVALAKWREALTWLQRYVTHQETNAFAVAGTLRQFREVWQLSDTSSDGSEALVLLLEAEMMKPRAVGGAGGQALNAPNSSALQSLRANAGKLQAVLGPEGYKPIGWLETGMLRSRAVARVTSKLRGGAGTGFLVRGCDLHPSLGNEQYFVTNHHVISYHHPLAFQPGEALISFEKLGGKPYTVKNFLFTSPVEELDATIIELDRPVKGVDPFPLCTAIPPLGASARVYVIGHPLGGQLALSMNDNLLIDHKDPKLHYRAPTDPGSSGSPVFDPFWNLLALHHAGDKEKMRRLHGRGYYAANEGLYFQAVASAFLASQKRKRATSTRGKARSARRAR